LKIVFRGLGNRVNVYTKVLEIFRKIKFCKKKFTWRTFMAIDGSSIPVTIVLLEVTFL
jgi:hypothetical protein